MTNARLLVFCRCPDNPVKLTLAPGQRVDWASPRIGNDEGWSQWGWSIEHRGHYVHRYAWNDGRDCDGRYGSTEEAVCPLSELRSFDGHHHQGLPNWNHGKCRIRDDSAAAAGY
jgi:hypothetical protein